MPKNAVEVVMFGGVYGDRYVSFPGSGPHTEGIIAKCVEAGVTKYIPNFQLGAVGTHPWVICHRSAETGQTEFRGEYQTNKYDESSPLLALVAEAHRHGLEVHPYVHIACSGVWLPKLRSPVNERIPLGYASLFGSQNPNYWTRLRDGRTWLDIDPNELSSGYGYLSLAYPEVRAYEISLFEEFVNSYEVDGVSLEFVTVMGDEQGVWPLGYDEPAIASYKSTYGRDIKDISNADEEWTRLRANYTTQLLRGLRENLRQMKRDAETSLATEGVWHNPADAYKLMVDWPTLGGGGAGGRALSPLLAL